MSQPQRPPQPAVGPLNDAGYNTQINALNRNFNDTQLGLGNREFGVREQYGFDPQFAQNPYTRANLLKKSYDQRFRGTTNSMAGRGQLYSGATDRARAADIFAHGADVDEAQRGYMAELAAIEAERLSAVRTRDQGSDEAYADMLQRALAAEPDPSMFPAGNAPPKPPKRPGSPRFSDRSPQRRTRRRQPLQAQKGRRTY